MKTLFLITARGGSKGIPGKNIKLLLDKPLLYYSLEYARLFAQDQDICLSTDSDEIVSCAAKIGYKVPFIRPKHLAQDNSSTYDVIVDCLSYYKRIGKYYDRIVLLQPTSPFRLREHLEGCFEAYTQETDMVVSVTSSDSNPYYNIFEETSLGYLKISKGHGQYIRRQDMPSVYKYNGSIYVINSRALESYASFADFTKIKKYEMEIKYSIDLDTQDDWDYATYKFGTAKQ